MIAALTSLFLLTMTSFAIVVMIMTIKGSSGKIVAALGYRPEAVMQTRAPRRVTRIVRHPIAPSISTSRAAAAA